MISTGRSGRAVAVVNGGTHDGTIIRIVDEDKASEAVTPKRDLNEVLDEGDFIEDPKKYKAISLRQRMAIAEALKNGSLQVVSSEEDSEEDEGDDPTTEEEAGSGPKPRVVMRGVPKRPPMGRVELRIAKAYRDKSRYEYRLDDGKMVVLPSPETERVFVAAKSGAGKSTWAASYVREYQEMFQDRRVFLFSTHGGEKAYAALPHGAYILDDSFVQAPPSKEDLALSLCVFDDCDNLQDKKLMQAVEKLNADLICNGRKYNIHVLTLNHVLMDRDKTRKQLIEANRVVFFPGGSPYHDIRFLKTYAGQSGSWVKKILAERSRWICMDLRLPVSYVTENAVVVIGSRAAPP